MWLGTIVFVALFVIGLAFGALVFVPDKWDRATVVRICRDGTPILRLADGSIWARRNGLRHYRVEDERTVCE